jgi:hypothetical protein
MFRVRTSPGTASISLDMDPVASARNNRNRNLLSGENFTHGFRARVAAVNLFGKQPQTDFIHSYQALISYQAHISE